MFWNASHPPPPIDYSDDDFAPTQFNNIHKCVTAIFQPICLLINRTNCFALTQSQVSVFIAIQVSLINLVPAHGSNTMYGIGLFLMPKTKGKWFHFNQVRICHHSSKRGDMRNAKNIPNLLRPGDAYFQHWIGPSIGSDGDSPDRCQVITGTNTVTF